MRQGCVFSVPGCSARAETGRAFRASGGQRCAPFDAPDDDGLAAERAARDRAIDVGHDGEALFHETRVDELLHLRRLRERRLTAVFGCDNDAAANLTYRIDCLERGQADPGETR